MKKFQLIITLILLVAIVLPASFFIVRHFSSLTENEQIIQEVFEKQMETVLFSLNQLTENNLNLWVNKLDVPVEPSSDFMKNMVRRLFDNNPSIQSLTFFPLALEEKVEFFRDELKHEDVLIPADSIIRRLIEFSEANYQRIEALRDSEFTHFYFVPVNLSGSYLLALKIHTRTFVAQNMGGGIQQMAGETFSVSVIDTFHAETVYRYSETDTGGPNSFRKASWYLPGYVFSIRLPSATIDELVYERSRRDNYLFIGLAVFMLAGLLIVLGSVRKEIQLTDLKSEFVSNVSHEIRTPLALISMYAETLLLKRVKTDEKRDEYLRVIHSETDRLTGLVNRILAFSKLEGNKRKFHSTEFDLNNLLEELHEIYRPHFTRYNVAVTLDLAEEPLRVIADREAVSECVSNLIDNAIKYGREEGKTIRIHAFRADTAIAVEVADNGIGIPKKYQKHIFDKFYRVTQGNLASVAKGSGLGLNIVQKIMKAHAGKVTVKSDAGKGSCFTLLFTIKNNHHGKNTDH
ncbi:MAG TPA: HAMP domain-containing sensor histidine kinase [Prolixibacteraceae bacterium]|nr:HAMP domain-containing sensor histidine kinase [Prolixibacteraceae bacterium]